MKCGLIWARRARSSASMARVRSRPTGPPSWLRLSGRPPRWRGPARRSPGGRRRRGRRRRPLGDEGATTAAGDQSGSGQWSSDDRLAAGLAVRAPPTSLPPVRRRPRPSQARSPPRSEMATALVPSMARRCAAASRCPRPRARSAGVGRERGGVQRLVGRPVHVADRSRAPAAARTPEDQRGGRDGADEQRRLQVQAPDHGRERSSAWCHLPGLPQPCPLVRRGRGRSPWPSSSSGSRPPDVLSRLPSVASLV